jgi:hypothetical protein
MFAGKHSFDYEAVVVTETARHWSKARQQMMIASGKPKPGTDGGPFRPSVIVGLPILAPKPTVGLQLDAPGTSNILQPHQDHAL